MKIYDADKLIKEEKGIHFKGFTYKFTKIPVYFQIKLIKLVDLSKKAEKGDLEALSEYLNQFADLLASFLSGCGRKVEKQFLLDNMEVETMMGIATWMANGAKDGTDKVEETEKKSEGTTPL